MNFVVKAEERNNLIFLSRLLDFFYFLNISIVKVTIDPLNNNGINQMNKKIVICLFTLVLSCENVNADTLNDFKRCKAINNISSNSAFLKTLNINDKNELIGLMDKCNDIADKALKRVNYCKALRIAMDSNAIETNKASLNEYTECVLFVKEINDISSNL